MAYAMALMTIICSYHLRDLKNTLHTSRVTILDFKFHVETHVELRICSITYIFRSDWESYGH